MIYSPKLKLTLQFPAAKAFPQHKAILTYATVVNWLKAALFMNAEFTVRFIDAEEGSRLNYTYRGKNYATNVLTFVYAQSTDDPIMGDLILCCPVVEREAVAQAKLLTTHYAHLLVHGTLHAQGYDHETKYAAEEMEALEIDIMTSLGFPNPYCDPSNQTTLR